MTERWISSVFKSYFQTIKVVFLSNRRSVGVYLIIFIRLIKWRLNLAEEVFVFINLENAIINVRREGTIEKNIAQMRLIIALGKSGSLSNEMNCISGREGREGSTSAQSLAPISCRRKRKGCWETAHESQSCDDNTQEPKKHRVPRMMFQIIFEAVHEILIYQPGPDL